MTRATQRLKASPAARRIAAAEALSAWRERLGISQALAAQRLKVPVGTLQRWEQGRNGGPRMMDKLREYGIEL